MTVDKKELPQDPASKKARAIERAQARHRKRAFALKKKEPKIPSYVSTLVSVVPSLRKKVNIVRKNPLSTVKNEIKVIKRQGGTLRFQKALRDERRQHVAKKVAAKKAKNEANKKTKKYQICRMRKVYHTQLPLRSAAPKGSCKPVKRQTKLRKSLVPGTVCIIVAGRHQGKKVIFLKQLPRSGLCLVTGPYSVNKVPLRRCDQNYLIATSNRVPLGDNFRVPGHVDDFFFKKKRGTKTQKTTKVNATTIKGSKSKKTVKKPDLVRKKAQRFIDNAVLKAFKKTDRDLKGYMRVGFTLIGDRYAHNLKF